MKRPHLVHFLCIMTKDSMNIRASVTMDHANRKRPEIIGLKPTMPIQALRLLNAYEFEMKVVGLDEEHNEIYHKTFESDSFGNFYIKIPMNEQRSKIKALQVYETKKNPGVEFNLGTFMPIFIEEPQKLIICDFDKTLVDTRYSTTKEVYISLTKPVNYFPTIENSVEILRSYIEEGYHPFILSASPHFYEHAIRDWLYQNKIYKAGIFLKDYRKVFSFFETDLTPKDLKTQGLYKLNHLLDILLMTGIPNELILMGDNFESDPVIYLSLAKILKEDLEPWEVWNQLKAHEAFKLNKKQNTLFLNKIYQLSNQQEKTSNKDVNIKIFIRKKVDEIDITVPEFLNNQKPLLELYHGPSLQLSTSH